MKLQGSEKAVVARHEAGHAVVGTAVANLLPGQPRVEVNGRAIKHSDQSFAYPCILLNLKERRDFLLHVDVLIRMLRRRGPHQ